MCFYATRGQLDGGRTNRGLKKILKSVRITLLVLAAHDPRAVRQRTAKLGQERRAHTIDAGDEEHRDEQHRRREADEEHLRRVDKDEGGGVDHRAGKRQEGEDPRVVDEKKRHEVEDDDSKCRPPKGDTHVVGGGRLCKGHEGVQHHHLQTDVEEEDHVEPRDAVVGEEDKECREEARGDDARAGGGVGVIKIVVVLQKWEGEEEEGKEGHRKDALGHAHAKLAGLGRHGRRRSGNRHLDILWSGAGARSDLAVETSETGCLCWHLCQKTSWGGWEVLGVTTLPL